MSLMSLTRVPSPYCHVGVSQPPCASGLPPPCLLPSPCVDFPGYARTVLGALTWLLSSAQASGVSSVVLHGVDVERAWTHVYTSHPQPWQWQARTLETLLAAGGHDPYLIQPGLLTRRTLAQVSTPAWGYGASWSTARPSRVLPPVADLCLRGSGCGRRRFWCFGRPHGLCAILPCCGLPSRCSERNSPPHASRWAGLLKHLTLTALGSNLTSHYSSGDQAVLLMSLLVLHPLVMQVAYAWRGSLLRAELVNKSHSERAPTDATTPQRSVRRNPHSQAKA